jgi:hypothetical protein
MNARAPICLALAAAMGAVALWQLPFPEGNVLAQIVAVEQPLLYQIGRGAYVAMLFTTPYIACSVVASLAYIFVARPVRVATAAALPRYPEVCDRRELFVVLGEVHHAKRFEPSEHPQWLTIPDRGLYTGIMVLGAIGSGKTSTCMVPYAEQVLGYRAADPDRRIGGLVLEVKGDFCHQVRSILERHGRATDYTEIRLDGDVRYNPLHNDLDAYVLAYGIATLLNNTFGKSREPFWQQAYTNLVKFVILLHKLLFDYVTLFEVYQGAINPDYLEDLIKEGDKRMASAHVAVSFEDFMALRALETFPFERHAQVDEMQAPLTSELRQVLEAHRTPYRLVEVHDVPEGPQGTVPPWNEEKREQFDAVRRWFYQDWLRIDQKLRTSIVQGISVFLSLFDDNPAVKRVFCPPKETYDRVVNADGRYGTPLAPFAELIERGTVCALNFPVSANPGLARTIGTLMKQDFQRAVLNRIPAMERTPDAPWRAVLFLCDEYHSFATVGENDPSGDEKFFALSRQAKCVPVVATHSLSSLRSTLPGESWRTLLQTFRTKIFLTLADDFSAKTASELCGKEEQLKPNYTLSEQGQDAGVSVFTGRAAAQRSSIGTTKGYSVQRDFVFEPKVFAELKNAQAIVLAYDGRSPLPPSYLYLKPYYLDANTSYFEQAARGEL